MPNCAVFGCGNYSRKTKGSFIKYHRFPKDVELTKQWVITCQRGDKINIKHATICSLHFTPSNYVIPLKQQLLNYNPRNSRNLKKDAVPTENLPTRKKEKSTDRQKRIEVRNRKELVADILKAAEKSTDSQEGLENMHEYIQEEAGSSDALKVDQSKYEQLCENFQAVLAENKRLLGELEIERTNSQTINKKNDELMKEVENLKKELPANINSILSGIFTLGQIKSLLNPKLKSIRWSSEDIAAAISLRSVSAKAYRYLRKNKYPLPALSTLRKWALSLNLNTGVLTDVIQLMKLKSTDFTDRGRLAILSFDEIYVSNKICIEKTSQQKLGPSKSCQTAMVRGLMAPWKQPVYYEFDQTMTKDIIVDIITQHYDAGYIVVAMVSDMGTKNMGLWSALNIGHDKNCFYPHPCKENLKVFVFADVPHLLKLVRNHLIDSGFAISNHFINRTCLEKLIDINSNDLKIAFKISKYHLDVRGSERQKVRPAAQIFSNNTAKALEWCGMNGYLGNTNWKETSKFLKLINDWFDLFNSKSKYGSHPGVNAFGVDIDSQMKILKSITEVFTTMKVGKHKTLVQFQKGVLLCNHSLIGLRQYLNEMHNSTLYIITYRLNQDILENFFSYVRGMGGCSDHPTPLEFRYRLRWYILGKHSASVFTMNRNTEEMDNEASLLTPQDTLNLACDDNVCLSQAVIGNLVSTKYEYSTTELQDDEFFTPETFIDPFDENDSTQMELSTEAENLLRKIETEKTITFEGLKYISGYVAYRFSKKYPQLGNATKELSCIGTPDWIQYVSRGYLKYPNDDLIRAASTMEQEFNSFHGQSLSSELHIFEKVAQRTAEKLPANVLIPHEALLCLVRTRTYIRLRILNAKISLENCKKKLNKKFSKITNNKSLKKQHGSA